MAMALSFTILGCFTLYGKSKYFPEYLSKVRRFLNNHGVLTSALGYLFLLISALLFSYSYGTATGLILFALCVFMVLSLLVIALPLGRNYFYSFLLTIFLAPIIQFIL